MLSNVKGHKRVISYFRETLATQGEFPTCLLFHGPDGVGKHTLAVSLAKVLNCSRDKSASCECLSCRKIDGGHHLDVLQYEPDGNTFKIDQVRDLLVEADQNRKEGEYRIFILDDIHLLNAQSADALLKTLEDGRPDTVFILLATSRSEIVPTLLSRSLDFYMGRLSYEEVLSVLSMKGHRGVTAQEAARLSSGSVSTALFYLDGPGFEIRNDALSLLQDYPKVNDFQVIMKLNDYEGDRLYELIDAVYVLLSDLCVAQRGLTLFIQNQDQEQRICALSDRLGPQCFNAFCEVRDLRQRRAESVAFAHHAKATLLNLKDVFRA